MEPCEAYDSFGVMEQCPAYAGVSAFTQEDQTQLQEYQTAQSKNTGDLEAQYYTTMNGGPIYQCVDLK